MKTSVRQLAAGTFIALLFLVGNVHAKGTETKISSLETVETTLQLESWMTDETIWNLNFVVFSECIQETQAALELEDWMTNHEAWNLNHIFVEELESGLELEDWMINDDNWNINYVENESELSVEPWMINENIWK